MSNVDAADIQAALEGNGEAYGRLVRRYQSEIGQTMWRFTRDRNDFEELVQEVFVQAYSSLASYRSRAPFLHWLRRVATRVGYRYWKQQSGDRRRKSVSLQDWDEEAEARAGALSECEAAERVHALLAQMRPRDRLVLTLMYLEERTVAETAEMTGWSETMVKVQAYRARKKLRKLLEEAQEK